MFIGLKIIWTLLSLWHKTWKGNILLEIGQEAAKYLYFDQVKLDFGHWKKLWLSLATLHMK